MDNRRIAQELTRLARYLGDHKASLYRVRAYRRAAETVLSLDEAIEAIVASRGRKGLQELPGIGSRISRTIEDLVRTGRAPNVN
jgi:DNA polymerase (family 10)